MFDSNSLLYAPVQNYKTYLRNTLGKTSVDTRLITYEELTGLGCSKDDWSCTSAPSWVYGINYWVAAANGNFTVWNVNSYGDVGSDSFGNSGDFGLRPVITIDKSEL